LFFASTGIVELPRYKTFKTVKWKKEKIARGLIWKHAHPSFFDTQQNVNVLVVNTKVRHVTLVYNPEQNRLTSEMAEEAGGIGAINAGFFDMKNGGSVTYIKVDGQVPDRDTTKWRWTEVRNGAMIIRRNGTFDLATATNSRDYTKNEKYDDVLITGPLLIENGMIIRLAETPFVTLRHPRTSLGLIKAHKVVMVTVDGRTEESGGMTLHELGRLMAMLKCQKAINLDGGGSTTMWLQNKGVVNKPSDNKQFDHEGERRVSNIIVIQ
jgi:exopolysaccharide biosynthesis protein